MENLIETASQAAQASAGIEQLNTRLGQTAASFGALSAAALPSLQVISGSLQSIGGFFGTLGGSIAIFSGSLLALAPAGTVFDIMTGQAAVFTSQLLALSTLGATLGLAEPLKEINDNLTVLTETITNTQGGLGGFWDSIVEGTGFLSSLTGIITALTKEMWLHDKATAALTLGKKLLNAETWISIGHWIKDTAATIASTAAKTAHHAITGLQTVAQGALNLIMSANPIALVVIAITALVAAFVILWNKCDGFREFMCNFFHTIVNGFIGFVNLLIKGINLLLELVLMPFNLIIKGLNLIPGVNLPAFTVQIPTIPPFADGGYPSSGQMFIAREAGPELVGTIGSRSAVVNNDQIVESVSAGVYRAVKAAMGQNGGGAIQLILDGTKVAEVVSDNVNAITRRTGRCPIMV